MELVLPAHKAHRAHEAPKAHEVILATLEIRVEQAQLATLVKGGQLAQLVLRVLLVPTGKMEDRVPKVTPAQLVLSARMVQLAELVPKVKQARADLRVKRVPMAPLGERVLRARRVPAVPLAI